MVDRRHGVFVIHRHSLVRAGIRGRLEGDGHYSVVEEASSVLQGQLRMSCLSASIGFLVAELQVADGSGLELLREARLREPPVEVIVLMSVASPRRLRQALSIGARGLILEDAGGDALLEALQCAEAGNVYVDPQLGGALVEAMAARETVGAQAEEERLLELLARGLTYEEIAGVLGTTRGRVGRDIGALLRRMGASNRAAAVSLAVSRGTLC